MDRVKKSFNIVSGNNLKPEEYAEKILEYIGKDNFEHGKHFEMSNQVSNVILTVYHQYFTTKKGLSAIINYDVIKHNAGTHLDVNVFANTEGEISDLKNELEEICEVEK